MLCLSVHSSWELYIVCISRSRLLLASSCFSFDCRLLFSLCLLGRCAYILNDGVLGSCNCAICTYTAVPDFLSIITLYNHGQEVSIQQTLLLWLSSESAFCCFCFSETLNFVSSATFCCFCVLFAPHIISLPLYFSAALFVFHALTPLFLLLWMYTYLFTITMTVIKYLLTTNRLWARSLPFM